VGFPDEPYRYVQPPSGQGSTAPPSTVHGQLHMVGGLNPKEADFASAESGPQIELYFPAKSVNSDAASGSSVVEVGLTPIPLVQPPVGDVDSDVYRVEMTTRGASVTPSHGATIQILLRASDPNLAAPVMNYRPTSGDPWRGLHTLRPGQDVFGSAFAGPGEYLLDQPRSAPGGSSVGPQGPAGGRSPVVLLGVGVLVVVVLLLGVRLRARSRTRGPPPPREPSTSTSVTAESGCCSRASLLRWCCG
jgi:hypothetical protein